MKNFDFSSISKPYGCAVHNTLCVCVRAPKACLLSQAWLLKVFLCKLSFETFKCVYWYIFAIWLAGNSLLKTLYNAMQWINWIGGRWRTQLNAWHNVNCRTHEHRQFERILQVCAHCTPTLVSGSVDTRSIFFIVWSVITYNGQIKMPAQCSAVAQYNNSWILMLYGLVAITAA